MAYQDKRLTSNPDMKVIVRGLTLISKVLCLNALEVDLNSL